MSMNDWSRSSVVYGRKLFHSGVDGARAGRESFLHGESIEPYLNESLRNAVVPAAIAALIGFLGSCSESRQRSAAKALGYGVLGGAIGFGAGMAWESRRLSASVASGAMKSIGKVRDEHWLEKNPIDYA